MGVTSDGRCDSLLAPHAESLPQAPGQAHTNMQPKQDRTFALGCRNFAMLSCHSFATVLTEGASAAAICGSVDASAMGI